MKVSAETHQRLGRLGRTDETYGEVITRLVENEKNAKYIVVDGYNNWLECGSFISPEEALLSAYEAGAYTPGVKIYVYRGVEVLRVDGEEAA